MGAEFITRRLGGRWYGAYGVAHCPAHKNTRTPALSLSDGEEGRLLVHCFAGCEHLAILEALRARGLMGCMNASSKPVNRHPVRIHQHKVERERTEAAMCIWNRSGPTTGTAAETYLRRRGLKIPLPPSLRFHPALKHPGGKRWPALVALVVSGRDGRPVGVHRTFLASNGEGKAPVEPQRMMLGPYRGGAVRLGEADEGLHVGEGIESCLSAMQATGQPAWAALSTSGLRVLDLPDTAINVVILADGDEAGEAAAVRAAGRWEMRGRRVLIARPPQGLDFNDMLRGETMFEAGGTS